MSSEYLSNNKHQGSTPKSELSSEPVLSDSNPIVALVRDLSIEVGRYSAVYASSQSMHPTDLEALAYLCQAADGARPLAPGELSEAISLSPPATSAMLNRLERAGHIRREQARHDGRRVLIYPQPSAVEAVSAFYEPLGQAIASAVAGLTEVERRVLEESLAQIVRATQATRLEAAAGQARSAE